jgi:hypothetical protein
MVISTSQLIAAISPNEGIAENISLCEGLGFQ